MAGKPGRARRTVVTRLSRPPTTATQNTSTHGKVEYAAQVSVTAHNESPLFEPELHCWSHRTNTAQFSGLIRATARELRLPCIKPNKPQTAFFTLLQYCISFGLGPHMTRPRSRLRSAGRGHYIVARAHLPPNPFSILVHRLPGFPLIP